MRFMLGLLLVFAFVGVVKGRFTGLFGAKSKPVSTQLLATPSCEGRQLCGIAYIAPWCPACNQLIPVLQMISKLGGLHHGNYGAFVVVGKGRDLAEDRAKAREVGGDALVDEGDRYYDALGIDRYPTFVVVDAAGNVRHRDQAAFNWMQREIIGH